MYLSYGGGRGIRTPVRVTPQTVFKTAGFNHSPIPPPFILPDFTMLPILSRSVEMAVARGIGGRICISWRGQRLGPGGTWRERARQKASRANGHESSFLAEGYQVFH